MRSLGEKRALVGALLAAFIGLGLATIEAPSAFADEPAPVGTVSGVITLDGVPAGGLTVCDTSGNCELSGADGSYTLTNVAAGPMTCLAVMPVTDQQHKSFPITSYPSHTRSSCEYFDLAADQTLTDKNIAVVSYPVVSGRVLDPSGAPVAGVQVSGNGVSTLTGADGRYELQVPADYDGFDLVASRDGYRTTARHLTEGGAIDLVLEPLTNSGEVVGVNPAPSVATAPGLVTATKPVVVGKAKVGRTVRAAVGTWGPRGVALSYQWYRNGKPVAGATVARYRITGKDLRKRLSVTVTGAISGTGSVSKPSAARKVTR